MELKYHSKSFARWYHAAFALRRQREYQITLPENGPAHPTTRPARLKTGLPSIFQVGARFFRYNKLSRAYKERYRASDRKKYKNWKNTVYRKEIGSRKPKRISLWCGHLNSVSASSLSVGFRISFFSATVQDNCTVRSINCIFTLQCCSRAAWPMVARSIRNYFHLNRFQTVRDCHLSRL